MPVSIQEIIHEYHRAQREPEKEREKDRKMERNQGVKELIKRVFYEQ